MTKEQFKELFDKLDLDGDGKISYEDFHGTVGSEISPVEFLYFRQDLPRQKVVTCRFENCWEATKGMGRYCHLHSKIFRDRAVMIFSQWQGRLGEELWSTFLGKVRVRGGETAIEKSVFWRICESVGLQPSSEEKDVLIESFHLKDEGNQTGLCLARLFEMTATRKINRLYREIDLEKREEDEEEQRSLRGLPDGGRLVPVGEEELVAAVAKEPKLRELTREFRMLDKDNNGFLTAGELNLVFSRVFADLHGKSMLKAFRPFASAQNKHLIDYKRLKAHIVERLDGVAPRRAECASLSPPRRKDETVHEAAAAAVAAAAVSAQELHSPVKDAGQLTQRMAQIKDEILAGGAKEVQEPALPFASRSRSSFFRKGLSAHADHALRRSGEGFGARNASCADLRESARSAAQPEAKRERVASHSPRSPSPPHGRSPSTGLSSKFSVTTGAFFDSKRVRATLQAARRRSARSWRTSGGASTALSALST